MISTIKSKFNQSFGVRALRGDAPYGNAAPCNIHIQNFEGANQKR
ncbi:MAG: hypothetical protein Q7K45_02390 [Nanoarchaeota archaeon]|nr:hypothetical protein [Nanoarchaeota archaeon]